MQLAAQALLARQAEERSRQGNQGAKQTRRAQHPVVGQKTRHQRQGQQHQPNAAPEDIELQGAGNAGTVDAAVEHPGKQLQRQRHAGRRQQDGQRLGIVRGAYVVGIRPHPTVRRFAHEYEHDRHHPKQEIRHPHKADSLLDLFFHISYIYKCIHVIAQQAEQGLTGCR